MTQRVKYTFEYLFKAKDELLYAYVASPHNLPTWFVKDIKIEGDVFSITWGVAWERIKQIKTIPKKLVIYKWLDREGDEELTFEINTDEVTNSTILRVSDYDNEEEIEEARQWWDNTIENLKRIIGG